VIGQTVPRETDLVSNCANGPGILTDLVGGAVVYFVLSFVSERCGGLG